MKNPLIVILPFLLSLALTSCYVDKSPLAPILSDSLYTGGNGYIINGGDYWYTQVDYGKVTAEYSDPLNIGYEIIFDFGTLNKVSTTLNLALPSKITANTEYRWANSQILSRGFTFARMDQDDEPILTSVKGSTTILEVGEIGGPIVGKFSGVLEDGDHNRYSINGKFHALRVH